MPSRLSRLNARRIDSSIISAKLFNESYQKINQSDSVRYVIGAMQPIDPEYTKNTYLQGERVINQLKNRLTEHCDYEYQGSVTNDTHIKAQSDIDILVLIGKFFTLELPQEPSSPYQGNPIQDLLDLRDESIEILESAFPQADVDSSGSKSIAIEGGSLTRKIDVVPSNWFNTNDYKTTGSKVYRGVQILDARKKIRLKNTPFLHNKKIEEKDKRTQGGLRKAARLMKSLKYDSDSIDLSSYDIVSITYNMDDSILKVPKGLELSLLASCLNFCEKLQQDKYLRESLSVPDGHRKIFTEGHATVQGLNQLTDELRNLTNDVLTENARSFNKLAEARIEY
jgi:hypothetical protein